MAFIKTDFRTGDSTGAAPALHTYVTFDAKSTVMTSGYFNGLLGALDANDFIVVYSTSESYIVRVTSTALPIAVTLHSSLSGAYDFSAFQYVSKLADLPDPVGDVITLDGDKCYFFQGEIDLLGDRFVLGENTCFLGASSENAFLASTGLTGSPLIRTDYTFPMRHLTIQNAETAVDVNPGDLANTIALDWTGVNFSGCGTNLQCGDIGNFIFSKGAVLGGGKIIFNGQMGTVGIDNSLFVGDGAAENLFEIPASAVVSRRFRIIYSSFVVFGSTVGISVSASATIPNQAYILDNVNFSGGGTYLAGVGSTDNKALFVSNVGIQNSADIAQYYMNGNATATTVSSTGVPYKVAGTTTNGAVTSKFTHANNRATYVGALTKFFKVTVTISVESGNNNQVGIYIAKNGAVIDESEVYGTTSGSGRVENITAQTLALLTNGDYIEIFAENNSAIQDITATDLNVVIE